MLLNKKNNGFIKKIYKSVVFSFILISGIFIIGLGYEYINLSGESNPLVIEDGILSILSCGILILLLGGFLLYLLINSSEFEISFISLFMSSIILSVVFLTWDTMSNFGSTWTQTDLNFNILLISFLLFWNIILFKSLFESQNHFIVKT